MKKILLVLGIMSGGLLISSHSIIKEVTKERLYSEYCSGWKEGYCEGWKDVKGQLAICPITPICPIPRLGQDSYRDGYNRGFKAGSLAADND
jgi:hypothetical protein